MTLVTKYPLIGPPPIEDQTFTVYLGASDAHVRDTLQFDRRIKLFSSQESSILSFTSTVNVGAGVQELRFSATDLIDGVGPFKVTATRDTIDTIITTVVMFTNGTYASDIFG